MATDKSTILKTFNQTFFDFMNDVISIFPENTDIVTGKKFFELTKKANPTIIIKIWNSSIYTPYKDAINAGDVTFFFEKNYEEDLGNFENANEVLKFIDSFREPIRLMSDTNKAHSMQYIQILSKLSDVYVSL
jgi:hypothetical protein